LKGFGDVVNRFVAAGAPIPVKKRIALLEQRLNANINIQQARLLLVQKHEAEAQEKIQDAKQLQKDILATEKNMSNAIQQERDAVLTAIQENDIYATQYHFTVITELLQDLPVQMKKGLAKDLKDLEKTVSVLLKKKPKT